MPVLDDVVLSPCVRACTLDDGDVCIGCGRTLDEIRQWGGADAAERRRIIALAEIRAAETRKARKVRAFA